MKAELAGWTTRIQIAVSLAIFLLLMKCGGDDGATDPDGGDDLQPGDLYVDIYDPGRACNGTTLFAVLHDPTNPRIIEIDMDAEIVWEYDIPEELKEFRDPGMDVELLSSGNILFVLPRNGVYEIDRTGTTQWSHLDENISHDADRLENGNTLYVFGAADGVNEAQVKEVNTQGDLVWSWFARDYFYVEPYIGIARDGWTHTNAVTRMDNGNTLINLRNFNLTVEAGQQDSVLWSMDWGSLYEGDSHLGFDPHEPEIQPGDGLLICLQHDTPYQIVEIDRSTGEPVWEYNREGLRTARDCDRLPNGNTLIVGVLGDDSVIFEVTSNREIVWQLRIKDTPAVNSPGWFYKAQRICSGN